MHEAKTRLSALLAEVERGEEFIIARGSVEVARLVPLVSATRRDLGFVPYDVPDSFFDALPSGELDRWER